MFKFPHRSVKKFGLCFADTITFPETKSGIALNVCFSKKNARDLRKLLFMKELRT